MSSLRLALVQKASSLESAENRDALAAVARALEPDTGLVVLPEAFMRDFGAPGSDLAAVAEPLDGPFVAALTAFAAEQGTTVVAGMFETSDDPERPFNTLAVVDRDGLRASYRKIHLYDSFGYKESDRLARRPGRAGAARRRRVPGRADDLLRPALPRARPRAGGPRRRAPRRARPRGWPAPARCTTGGRWRPRGRSRTPCTSPRSASPAPATPVTRWSSGRPGELVAELGDGDHVLAASVGRDALDEARATNPSLANRRF